jgi:hypothetical protein
MPKLQVPSGRPLSTKSTPTDVCSSFLWVESARTGDCRLGANDCITDMLHYVGPCQQLPAECNQLS